LAGRPRPVCCVSRPRALIDRLSHLLPQSAGVGGPVTMEALRALRLVKVSDCLFYGFVARLVVHVYITRPVLVHGHKTADDQKTRGNENWRKRWASWRCPGQTGIRSRPCGVVMMPCIVGGLCVSREITGKKN